MQSGPMKYKARRTEGLLATNKNKALILTESEEE